MKSSRSTKKKKVKKEPSKKRGRKKSLDMNALLTKVASLMVRHNAKELNFSRVSQLTSVPRSTLYYYFGKSPQTMIEEAARFAMKAFTQLYDIESQIQASSWKEFQKERIRRSAKMVSHYPWAPLLYLKHRDDPGEVGDTIRRIEKQWQQKMAEAWRHFHKKDADPNGVLLSGSLKIGFQLALSVYLDLWFQKDMKELDEKLVEFMAETVTRAVEYRS